MNKKSLFLGAASLVLTSPVVAQTVPPSEADRRDRPVQTAPTQEVFSTGVARGRDRLDSAISTSVLRQEEILKLAPQSIGDLLRDIPGIRSEAHGGEGNANITIRGLPLSSTGAKFTQLQEDGLPILEFGDIVFATADSFLRADANLAQVEVIRGGSASTFASNSPGGLINFQSRTGDVEGGAVQLSRGLDHDQSRIDVNYGAKFSDTLRFHMGGFYREGEGPRRAGFDAKDGGQFKANLTKTFDGGYIRLYGKYLDDRTPVYDIMPLGVTGTNADPEFRDIAGFDIRRDALLSGDFSSTLTLDRDNDIQRRSTADGLHVTYRSIGLETQFKLGAGWTVTDRFRIADIGSTVFSTPSYMLLTPQAVSAAFAGGPGATFSYATGPMAGTPITNPGQLNGNGLFIVTSPSTHQYALDNITNDLRLSRVWTLGANELTTTFGLYNARQTIDYHWGVSTVLHDVRGDGRFALVNMRDASGRALTQDGILNFTSTNGPAFRRRVDVDYRTDAPFASANYRFGGISIGGSLRYDFGQVEGARNTAAFLTPPLVSRDMNGDGVISSPEQRVANFSASAARPMGYDYGYLSYSTGINVRVAEPWAVFARYSRGGRAAGDRFLFNAFFDATNNRLVNDDIEADMVKQAEAGVKYRNEGLTLNLTGFWAEAEDTNVDTVTIRPFEREYQAMGLEFEGGYRVGNFSLSGGLTYTDAEIVEDTTNPAVIGNTPRHQAEFIFQATPQYTTDRFSLGAVIIGTTDSFAQDQNQLVVPGYVTTNAFVQVRPSERILLSLNANNLFDVLAITSISDASIPVSGIVRAQTLTGRTVSATVRFAF